MRRGNRIGKKKSVEGVTFFLNLNEETVRARGKSERGIFKGKKKAMQSLP